MNPRSLPTVTASSVRRAVLVNFSLFLLVPIVRRLRLARGLYDDHILSKPPKWQKKLSEKEKKKILTKKQWHLNQQIRNWLDLPLDVMVNILYRIGVIDILENAQKVCTTWRKICKDPAMWRVIHMGKFLYRQHPQIQDMCKVAVNRSEGQLVDFSIVGFANAELLRHVADRSSQLKRLEIVCCSGDIQRNMTQALKKFPMLQELNLYNIKISAEAIEIVGCCCPMLKSLKVNHETCMYWHGGTNEKSLMIRNRTAIAIGENIHGLRHLELIGNNMTNIGLQAILNGCGHLESLDLRRCLYIDLKGDMGKKCSEKIKCLKLPKDSLEGCLYVYPSDCSIYAGVAVSTNTIFFIGQCNDIRAIYMLHFYMV
ncbi:hypothetical protein L1887_23594 [Cichorium endivia]|nr:hypothetical protein L1887_23594 [Cichorium endivia]